ncbi:MAG: GNAT family protein [Acidobacteriota bacterium]
MKDIKLRYQLIRDAKRYYEILTHPDFEMFPVEVGSIEEEKRFLRSAVQLRKDNVVHNYAITSGNELVGAVGIKIDQHRKYIGEVGYFVAREYWGKGIAPKAVALIEEIGFNELGLERIELVTLKHNRASIRVAQKCSYRKEGIQRHKQLHHGRYHDCYLFAKIKPGT